MASSGAHDCNSQANDSIGKSRSKIHSSEHEETIKSDQMAAKKLSTEKPHIEDFDETQLKSLLDEAMNYKNPRDANDKSETFKQLLKNVEEDMKRNENFNLGNYGLKQSNSLQNLLDDSHYQLNSHQSHTSSKKHHQRRKNSTSVSARRLEGGSLPIDMHHSSAVQSPSDQPFLSEYNHRRNKNKKETVIDMGDNETDEKKLMQRHFDTNKDGISSSYPHDGIEMKCYRNSVDFEVQDMTKNSSTPAQITTISSMTVPGSSPLATASIINSKVTSSATASSSAIHSVDRLIEFPSLVDQQNKVADLTTINHNNNIVLANHNLNFGVDPPLMLNSTYTAVTSITNEKATPKPYLNKQSNHDAAPAQSLTQPTPIVAAHQSAAATNSKEAKSKLKRSHKAERNEISIDVKMIQGFRGDDKLEDLLKYIEDGDGKTQKGHTKNGIVSTNQTSDHLLSAEEKKKKMTAKNKEKVNKLKKSNSMDELCSTGRQEQEQEEKSSTAANKIIQDVTLRSKSSNLTSGAKKGDKADKAQTKRNERRSWGTEGLWPETVDQTQDEHIELESSSSSNSEVVVETPAVVVPVVEPANAVVTETEFHVVMKKRKRKPNESESSKTPSYNMRRDGNIRPGTRKYNDRDTNQKTARSSKPLAPDAKASTNKSRRKSTSSMPPSDDDWNSDGGDSVQSLPIETTKTTSSQLLAVSATGETPPAASKTKKNTSNHQQQQQQQQKPATFSYADIAKTNRNSGANVAASTEKWPSISASSSSTSHQINNDPFSIANFDAVASSSSSNQKPHKSAPITTSMMSFPELVETNNHKNKQLSSNASSEHASNGEPINTTEKPLNGLDAPRAFDSNNNSNLAAAEERANSQKSYSQSLVESNLELDSNGNSVRGEAVAIAKVPLTKSKSVDHNNLSSIEHYPALEKTQATLGEVFSKTGVTFETYASKSKQKPLKFDQTKLTKRDKLKKSSSVQGAPFPPTSAGLNSRPAVIIMQDIAKASDNDCGITFGFDINQCLLQKPMNGVEGVTLANTINNNNCDIINTNLSSNNLTNQPSGLEAYESFMAPIIIGDHQPMMTIKGQPSPKQPLVDTSFVISNSPATHNSTYSGPHEGQHEPTTDEMKLKWVTILETCKLLQVPRYIAPDTVKFNEEELVSFVSDEWTKFSRHSVYFNGQ